jgi:hypothetical protein
MAFLQIKQENVIFLRYYKDIFELLERWLGCWYREERTKEYYYSKIFFNIFILLF